MKNNNLLLSIIILTNNNENCIKTCLNSINKYINHSDTELIIVDNNSTDNTLDILKKFKSKTKFNIKIIENKKNMGVSCGRNIGLKEAKGNYILFLDSDAYFIDKSVYIGIEFLQDNKDIGIVVPKMYYKNMDIQDNIRHFPTIKSKLHNAYLALLHKYNKKINIESKDYDEYRNQIIFEIDYGIGAYTLLKREVFKKVGFYDQHIFYGPEDADYALRAKKKGFKTFYNGNINIIHERQRLSHKKIFSFITFYHIKGLIYYFIKNRKN